MHSSITKIDGIDTVLVFKKKKKKKEVRMISSTILN